MQCKENHRLRKDKRNTDRLKDLRGKKNTHTGTREQPATEFLKLEIQTHMMNMKVQGKEQCNSEAGRGNTAYATECKPRREERGAEKNRLRWR